MSRRALRQLQWEKLSVGLVRVAVSNRFYQRRFSEAGISPTALRDWEEFERLPFTTKEELLADQEQNPPYGTNLTLPWRQYVRLHQTTGTSGRRLRWLDSRDGWRWLSEELWPAIFHAAGLNAADRLFFPFSFGPFLAFWAAFDAACRSGNFVLAGGGMTTVARLHLMLEHQASFVFCTPTYALRLAEVAEQEAIPLASSLVRGLILAGEPGASIPATRRRLEEAWGARVFDHSGMTEIGSLGAEYEELPGKLFLLEDHCIAEFLDPSTGRPVPEGELGEMVLTNLGRWDSPLIRYRTGDFVRWRADVAPRAAPHPYVYLDGGILSRGDDMLWIKGNNVYPSAIESVLREFAAVCEFRLEAAGAGGAANLVVVVEPFPGASTDGLAAAIETAMQDRLYFRPDVVLAAPGALPRFELKSRRLVRRPANDEPPALQE